MNCQKTVHVELAWGPREAKWADITVRFWGWQTGEGQLGLISQIKRKVDYGVYAA